MGRGGLCVERKEAPILDPTQDKSAGFQAQCRKNLDFILFNIHFQKANFALVKIHRLSGKQSLCVYSAGYKIEKCLKKEK